MSVWYPSPTQKVERIRRAFLGPDRDVLQVRIRGRQPSGGGHRLHERGVDATVGGDRALKAVDGHQQLGDIAVAQEVSEEWMLGLRERAPSEPQRRSCSPVLVRLVFGIPRSSKSTTCSCFGEPRFTSCPISAYAGLGGALHLGGELRPQGVQGVVIDRDADSLHRDKESRQGELDVSEQGLGSDLLRPRAEGQPRGRGWPAREHPVTGPEPSSASVSKLSCPSSVDSSRSRWSHRMLRSARS